MGYTIGKRVEDYEKLKAGDYECVIEKIEFANTLDKEPKIVLWYKVRDDVEQDGKNRIIFDNIYLDKTNKDVFDTKKIDNLCWSQPDVQENTYFEDIQAVIDYLKGKLIRIRLGYFTTDDGKERQTIRRYDQTQYPHKTLSDLEPTSNHTQTNALEDLTEDDLPF